MQEETEREMTNFMLLPPVIAFSVTDYLGLFNLIWCLSPTSENKSYEKKKPVQFIHFSKLAFQYRYLAENAVKY